MSDQYNLTRNPTCERREKGTFKVQQGPWQQNKFTHDQSVPPRPIEGQDDFTTQANKHLAYL